MQLSMVVPWGRCFKEYKEIFSLSQADLQVNILGCGDGPASFNAEATAAGAKVISVDPIYCFSANQIESRVNEVSHNIAQQLKENASNYIWSTFQNVEAVVSARLAAMKDFLKDYESGKKEGRYVEASLPLLTFKENQFTLALCSHFLFLYSEHITEEQHIAGVLELCRVTKEVRIYPLVTLDGRPSPYLAPVIEAVTSAGYSAETVAVPYSFQRNATEMLVVKSV
ncbi:hypothetical protein SAMN05216317_12230 [Nitrosomonas eutropha]|uniref:SAM-dependent methyltransferase n=1 Tax=Nitrosomonas TaxID=914 RepID=UPI0008961D3E|nr:MULTISPECIES: SAM-dependent methyltransferase [Nitrosomonas]MXS81286.1 SAM-dependent methyltransferase [Nitrosomonas sp. GH22]SDW99802.1 hypothetical protein SAMN05216317_12230 [Nitrosomonas eutropha]